MGENEYAVNLVLDLAFKTFFSRYVVGGRLLNIFTEFYLLSDDQSSIGSDPSDTPDYLQISSPKWIGAWWLGFLLVSDALNRSNSCFPPPALIPLAPPSSPSTSRAL